MRFSRYITFFLCALSISEGQVYQGYEADYADDNLYHDHAMRQNEKKGGLGFVHLALALSTGWLVGGKFHSSRLRKKLDSKHKKEQKTLYAQYYNDVYALQDHSARLENVLEELGVKVK
eukprot:CAMPEP_0194047672 /NCGR_PEP_ID=MMETSP0009_2-20130614/25108_1 /TAXON_ID=210454 /ORGANISM="Grammatophora oceanica, Strain CCMP 410" /LENGTH=118 /DNA_ID=CAMNT_0038693349 /DNA_START=45 /DNA_END=401 /DNA_ORIENTATION=+